MTATSVQRWVSRAAEVWRYSCTGLRRSALLLPSPRVEYGYCGRLDMYEIRVLEHRDPMVDPSVLATPTLVLVVSTTEARSARSRVGR